MANSILNSIAQTGQNIRGAYQRKSLVNPNRDYYFMQRNTGNTESITIEYGFLDSTKDDVSQLKNNWQIMTEAAIQGILNYITGNSLLENIYIVKKGDSLYSIANKNGVSVAEIIEYNNLAGDSLYVGQRLKLPNKINNIQENYYIVKAGDTLYNVAKSNNTSVDNIMKLNNLLNTNLYVGQKLLLNNTYTVKKGDTLYSIAKNNNTTIEKLKSNNSLNSNMLYVGQKIVI